MHATATLVDGTLQSEVLVRDRFWLHTDEPPAAGGDDTAPAPHELLPAALASCVTTTLAIYARTKGWELGELTVDVEYDAKSTPRRFRVDIHLAGDHDADRIARLERAAATCPVRRALEAGFLVEEHVHASIPA